METKQRLLIGVAVIVLVVSAIVIGRSLWRTGPRYCPVFDECLGGKVADATAQLLNGQGAIVVLSWGDSPVATAVIKAQLRGFERALAAHPGLKVVGTARPTREEEGPSPGGIPAPLVERALAEHPDAKAVVSFLGVPILEGRYGALDPARVPAVVALSLGEVERWQALINSKIPAAVVRNRHQLQGEAVVAGQTCDDFIAVSNTGEEAKGASPAAP